MRSRLLAVALLPLFLACTEQGRPAEKRMEVKKTGPAMIQVVPAAGQFPYCIVYTIAENGTVRQLTMGRYNESWKCDPGKPLGNRTFRVPIDEGKIRVLTIFSDKKLAIGPVSDQLFDLVHTHRDDLSRLQLTDMRLPGKVNIEWGEFVPEAEAPVVTGGEVKKGGTVAPPAVGTDGGTQPVPANGNGAPPPAPDAGTK